MISSNTTKLALAVSAALFIALPPRLATAQSSPAEAAASVDKLAVAAAPAEKPILGRYSEIGALRIGASVGPDFFSSTTGFRVQGDLQYTLFEVAPRMYLDVAAQVGAVFASGVTTIDFIVPKARVRYTFLDPLQLYGDAGLGLAFTSVSVPGGSDTNLLGNLRFAGGAQYKLTPDLSVTLEPVGLNIYFGTNSAFHYSILAGILYRVM
jgi:opacity protein-like surface antigen